MLPQKTKSGQTCSGRRVLTVSTLSTWWEYTADTLPSMKKTPRTSCKLLKDDKFVLFVEYFAYWYKNSHYLLEISSNPSQKSPTVAPVMISLVLQLTRSTSCWPNSFLKDSGLQRSAFNLWCTPDTITGCEEEEYIVKNYSAPKVLIPTRVMYKIHWTFEHGLFVNAQPALPGACCAFWSFFISSYEAASYTELLSSAAWITESENPRLAGTSRIIWSNYEMQGDSKI